MNLAPQTPPHPSGDKRFKLLDVAIKRHQFRQDALIEIPPTAGPTAVQPPRGAEQ